VWEDADSGFRIPIIDSFQSRIFYFNIFCLLYPNDMLQESNFCNMDNNYANWF